jgi:hypothetical protein
MLCTVMTTYTHKSRILLRFTYFLSLQNTHFINLISFPCAQLSAQGGFPQNAISSGFSMASSGILRNIGVHLQVHAALEASRPLLDIFTAFRNSKSVFKSPSFCRVLNSMYYFSFWQ